MKCPFCGSADTQVIDSRVSRGRRLDPPPPPLPGLQKRFTTYETVELRMPQVVKTDGTRSDFDRRRSCAPASSARCTSGRCRPSSSTQAIDRIVAQVLALGEREIPSRRLGEMVMQELYKLDKVAYIRFASVYRKLPGRRRLPRRDQGSRDARRRAPRRSASRGLVRRAA